MDFDQSPSLVFSLEYNDENLFASSLSLQDWKDKCRSDVIELMPSSLLERKIEQVIKEYDKDSFEKLVEGAKSNNEYMNDDRTAE